MIGGASGRVPSELTLDNWQSASHLQWTFQHIADFLPTAVISRGAGPVADLPSARPTSAHPVSELVISDTTNGRRRTVGDVMAATATDGWIVVQHGKVVEEHYYGEMAPDTSHLLMSVSKSLIATVAGALVGTGTLDVEARADSIRTRAGELWLCGRDRTASPRHAFGHSVFRGLPQSTRRGAAARTGHRLGTAHRARAADHHVRLSW